VEAVRTRVIGMGSGGCQDEGYRNGYVSSVTAPHRM
jgi:hypothetical protein